MSVYRIELHTDDGKRKLLERLVDVTASEARRVARNHQSGLNAGTVIASWGDGPKVRSEALANKHPLSTTGRQWISQLLGFGHRLDANTRQANRRRNKAARHARRKNR